MTCILHIVNIEKKCVLLKINTKKSTVQNQDNFIRRNLGGITGPQSRREETHGRKLCTAQEKHIRKG